MSSASANSSKRIKSNNGELVFTICPTAAEFDENVRVIPEKNRKFEFDLEGAKEISLFQNRGIVKDGKTLILNEKTKKAFGKRRTIPTSLDKNEVKSRKTDAVRE